jgi:hypothetical protein
VDGERTISELLEWQASLSPEERERFIAETWAKFDRLHDLNLPEFSDEDWDELDVVYRAKLTSAAPNRS